LIGLAEFGASGYRYCGNIMSSADDPQFEVERRLLDDMCGDRGRAARSSAWLV
jgi:hypothetical protein